MDTKRLDLNLLVTLEALLADQNVTRAARRLNLSQPAVSAQLVRLRDLFGDPLLIPAQRGMTPTAKAGELLAPLRNALDQVRATVGQHGHFDPDRARLTVAIACTDYLQAALVQPLVLQLRQRAPGVQIALRALDVPQLATQMARGEVDLALMTPGQAPPGLRSRHLFDERYVLIGRRGHPRLRRKLTASCRCAVATSPRPRMTSWPPSACAATWCCPRHRSCLCWISRPGPTSSRWCRNGS